MQLRKDITVSDTEVLSVVYTKQEFQMEDTAIAVYDKYKISILLSEDLRLFSIILQVILLCNDHYETEKNKKTPDNMPKIVAKTMRYISENFEKQLTLTELAADANCSVAYLSRIFKQHTGMTLYQYITAIRIANAQILLRKGLSVTEVCFAAGFNDCSNFICKFKKVTGITLLKFQKI